jgi:hypothetical protein
MSRKNSRLAAFSGILTHQSAAASRLSTILPISMFRPTLLHTGDTSHDVNILDTVQGRKYRPTAKSHTKAVLFAGAGVLTIAGAWGAFAAFGPPAANTASKTVAVSAVQTAVRAPALNRNHTVDAAPAEIAPIAAAPMPSMQPAVETTTSRVDASERRAIAATPAAPAPVSAGNSADELPTRTVADAKLSGSSAAPHKIPAARAASPAKREAQARAPADAAPRPKVQARSQPSSDPKDADVELLSALMKHMRHSELSQPTTRTGADAAASCRTVKGGDAKCPPRVGSP